MASNKNKQLIGPVKLCQKDVREACLGIQDVDSMLQGSSLGSFWLLKLLELKLELDLKKR